MSPYLSAGIVMCFIVAVALAATAYLAVAFNRRAKRDLDLALAPLAEIVGGSPNLDDASIQGRYGGHIVAGRMANAPGGVGRVFQTEIIDASGGTAWELLSWPNKQIPDQPEQRFASDDPALRDRLGPLADVAPAAGLDPRTGRFHLEYDPSAGYLRLSRAMRTRRDIPTPDAFRRQLDALIALGPRNRRAQGAPD